MASTFSDSPSLMLTSESVTEGHPDKLCDQISDAVLDALLEQDPYARVACEVAVNTGVVFVFGEISTSAWVDIPDTVRRTIREVGYDDSDVGFDWRTCGVISSLKEQAGDIARGVDSALEAREQGSEGPLRPGRRGRPGDDDRLRLRRDAGPHPAHDLARAPARTTADGAAQEWRAALPAPGRQDAGHGGVRVRPPEAPRGGGRLHAARPRRSHRAAARGRAAARDRIRLPRPSCSPGSTRARST